MIAKLAVKYGLVAGRPTRVISTDTHRIGGTDLLRRYSDAMGVKFEAPSKADMLERCLQTEQRNELVLIDTPGFTSRDSERATGLASLLSKRADTDVQLVLPAYACPADLAIMAARFKPFLPSKLIFTGMDDGAFGGSMLAHAIETDSPISYVGTGQAVPEDLEEASAAGLTARLLPGLIDAVASAA
jgi:flagellar biosynthesis protein FlhF